MTNISVCIVCFNEEMNIRRCLESVKWADEIIVVDSFSQDKTLEIAKEYTKHVYQHKWEGYTNQKNYALSLATSQWVLSLDADEAISEQLRDEILAEIKKPSVKNGYRIPRKAFFQGKWINHSGWYPDYQLRFFKRESTKWVGSRVHERAEIDGDVGTFKQDFFHYPYKGSSSELIKTVDEYSTLLAKNMYSEGKRFHIWLLLLRPFFKFLETYLLKLGFLDGVQGFVIAVVSSYTMFFRYIKLKELQKSSELRL